MKPVQSAWVLFHAYSDGSGVTIRRVYLDKARADEDFDLIRADPAADCGWRLEETFLYGDQTP